MEHPVDPKSPITAAPKSDGATGPILSWGVLSIIPLILPAIQIPLWANVDPPAEQFALPMMLIAQIVIAALLFPLLFRSRISAIGIMLGSAILMQLAGIMADASIGRIGVGILWIWMWQATLGLASGTLQSPRAQQIGVALATTAGIGGMILIYLHAEFAQGGAVGGAWWIGVVLAVLLGVAYIRWSLRSRQAIHR